MNAATAALAVELAACRSARNPFDRFNHTVLRRKPYWWRQNQIAQALADPDIRRVVVKAGHMVGKSHGAAGFALAWHAMYPDSGVVVLGPSLQQVRRAVWKEILKARAGSPALCRAGRIWAQPMQLDYAEGWSLMGVSGTEPERLQGWHPTGPILAIVDESSGVNNPAVDEALASLKPWKRLDISNPLKGYGPFFEAYQRALDDATMRAISIPSTDSPDIKLERSPRGLADASWLRGMLADYGPKTIRVRVGANFPEGDDDILIPAEFLDACGRAPHVRGGPIRLAMDLAQGNGGDDATELVRDDNGILEFSASDRRPLEKSAERAQKLATKYNIPPERISYDVGGLGAGFNLYLRNVGLNGCVDYNAARSSKDPKYNRLRDAAHFAMRRRLDPGRTADDGSARPVFHLHPDFLKRFRGECRALTYETLDSGRMHVRDAAEFKEAIGHSPDYSVTLAQSFAFSE